LEDQSLHKVAYTDTEHYAVTRQFLNNHEAMLARLLND
jgi:predicted ATPase